MGRIIPYIMENKKHVWNHQPEYINDGLVTIYTNSEHLPVNDGLYLYILILDTRHILFVVY